MHPHHFRVRILIDITRVVILPQILLYILLDTALVYLSVCLSLRTRLGLHLAVVPLPALWNCFVSSVQNHYAAVSMGAATIPSVCGKWPGNIDIVLKLVRSAREDYLMQYMSDLFEEYSCKTLNTRILWSDQIITIDDSHVKYMLTGPGFNWFHKGLYWQERFESFLGNGIFNRDKDEWSKHRAMCRPWFARERVSDLSLFDHHTRRTLAHIATFSKSHSAFDMQDLLGRFSLDTASEFLFGESLNTLGGALPLAGSAKLGPKGSALDDDFGTFAWAFEDVQVKISARLRMGTIWPLFELFRDKTKSSNGIVHDWLRPLVDRAMKEHQSEERELRRQTFLTHLIKNTDDADSIRFQILNMLLAGRDTTATALSFTIYFLCIHPDVCVRLRKEVIAACGEETLPTLDTLKTLKYLRAVLHETLRLFPPVPMNARYSDAEAHIFPSNERDRTPPYYVPPNSHILYNTLLIQRRKDVWGDDADDFRPERWLDKEVLRAVTQNPFIFVPFHAGPRICLGQNFAMNEMSFFLARLMQKFNSFTLASDAQPEGSLPPPGWTQEGRKGRQRTEKIWPMSSITTYIKGGLWVRALEA